MTGLSRASIRVGVLKLGRGGARASRMLSCAQQLTSTLCAGTIPDAVLILDAHANAWLLLLFALRAH